jgi:hypothetical protein
MVRKKNGQTQKIGTEANKLRAETRIGFVLIPESKIDSEYRRHDNSQHRSAAC